MKKILAAILIAAFLLAFPVQARAAGEPKVSADACVLMEAGTGEILLEKNADVQMLIASTTKIMLPATKKVTGTAQTQVFFRYHKTVVRTTKNVKPRFCFKSGSIRKQYAVTLMRPAADAPAQLVQLRQSETLSIFHDHKRRVGNVHSNFDDRRGNQNIILARGKSRHG